MTIHIQERPLKTAFEPAGPRSPDPVRAGPKHAANATAQDAALRQACASLWLATLSLMTAYMQNHAPAHRFLLARRIARNLDTLQDQDCFTAECRAGFARLARRWSDRAGHEPRHAAWQFDTGRAARVRIERCLGRLTRALAFVRHIRARVVCKLRIHLEGV